MSWWIILLCVLGFYIWIIPITTAIYWIRTISLTIKEIRIWPVFWNLLVSIIPLVGFFVIGSIAEWLRCLHEHGGFHYDTRNTLYEYLHGDTGFVFPFKKFFVKFCHLKIKL